VARFARPLTRFGDTHELGLDALYWRSLEEEEYGCLLWNLVPPTSRELPLPFIIEMVCFPRSWVPYRWPKLQPPCKLDISTYTPRGDLPDPDGGEAALDSGWNIRRGSVKERTGDPGRWLREVLKEARDQGRAKFVPYHMVEYYQQSPRARHNLYAVVQQWWKEVWVFENIYVPLPPILTYRVEFGCVTLQSLVLSIRIMCKDCGNYCMIFTLQY
jgi:hypothetical protein